MKEIEINGEKYVLKTDVDEKLKNNGFKLKYLFADLTHTMAFASCNISDDYHLLNMDLNLMKKALMIFKQFEQEHITFAFKQDFPLIMGIKDDEKNRINGVVIAPRIEKDKGD
jgi:hypothetical protein